MRKNESINIVLTPDGKVEVSAEGYKGDTCAQATRFLEEALGLNTDNRKKTAEWFQTKKVKQTQST